MTDDILKGEASISLALATCYTVGLKRQGLYVCTEHAEQIRLSVQWVSSSAQMFGVQDRKCLVPGCNEKAERGMPLCLKCAKKAEANA